MSAELKSAELTAQQLIRTFAIKFSLDNKEDNE
jgi:hypothetical protein